MVPMPLFIHKDATVIPKTKLELRHRHLHLQLLECSFSTDFRSHLNSDMFLFPERL